VAPGDSSIFGASAGFSRSLNPVNTPVRFDPTYSFTKNLPKKGDNPRNVKNFGQQQAKKREKKKEFSSVQFIT